MATNDDWRAATATSRNLTTVTARFKNYTLTSPTVYISFQTAYATNACGSQVGGAYSGALLPIHPTDLFSVQAQNDFFTSNLASSAVSTFYQSASFDFHDLTGFPRPEAYFAQPSCFAKGCTVVRSDDYRPYLVLPSQVRGLDPAWKTCGLDFRGSWDPPIALQPAGVVDAVTTESAPTYTATAMPESSGEVPARQTGANKPDSISTASMAASLVASFPSVAEPSATETGAPLATLSASSSEALTPVESLETSWGSHPEVGVIATSTPSFTTSSPGEPLYVAPTGTTLISEGRPDANTGAGSSAAVATLAVPSPSLSYSNASPSSTFSPSNAYDVLTAALPPTSAATIAIVTAPDGGLHTIAQEVEGYVFDSTTTVNPGQAATISGLGVISAGSDGQVYGFAATGTTTAGNSGTVSKGTARSPTTSAASLPDVATDSSYLPSVITRTVTREGTATSTLASGAIVTRPPCEGWLMVTVMLAIFVAFCNPR